MNNPALSVLTVVGILGVIAAAGLFVALSSGLFNTDLSPLVALVPLGVGVIAGVGALVIWGVGRGAAAGR